MALGDLIYVKLLQSLAGYGQQGTIVQLTETAEIEALIADGRMALSDGPAGSGSSSYRIPDAWVADLADVFAPAAPWQQPRAKRKQTDKRQIDGPANGASVELVNIPGAGVLDWLTIICSSTYGAYDFLLRVYTDGKADPDIEMDLGTLFGYQFGIDYRPGAASYAHIACRHIVAMEGNTDASGYLDTAVVTQGTIKYEMPYADGIRITLTNSLSNATGTVWVNAAYTPMTAAPTPWRLKAAGYSQADGPDCPNFAAGDDVPLCSIDGGPGLVVCQTIVGKGHADLSWLERSMLVTVDDEETPSLSSSGTEDWFGSAFDFIGAPFSSDWAMSPGRRVPSGDTLDIGKATGTIDLLAKDGGIPFEDSIAFVLHPNGGAAITTAARISSCTLYYQ